MRSKFFKPWPLAVGFLLGAFAWPMVRGRIPRP